MDPLRSIPKLETVVRKTRPELAVARDTGVERWPRILDWAARVKLTTREPRKDECIVWRSSRQSW